VNSATKLTRFKNAGWSRVTHRMHPVHYRSLLYIHNWIGGTSLRATFRWRHSRLGAAGRAGRR